MITMHDLPRDIYKRYIQETVEDYQKEVDDYLRKAANALRK